MDKVNFFPPDLLKVVCVLLLEDNLAEFECTTMYFPCKDVWEKNAIKDRVVQRRVPLA